MFRRIYRITNSLTPKQTFRAISVSQPRWIDTMKIDDNFDPKALEEQIANIKQKIEDDKQKEQLSEDKNEEIKKAVFTSEEVSGEWKLHFKNIEWENEGVSPQYMVLGKLRSLSTYTLFCILLFRKKDKGNDTLELRPFVFLFLIDSKTNEICCFFINTKYVSMM